MEVAAAHGVPVLRWPRVPVPLSSEAAELALRATLLMLRKIPSAVLDADWLPLLAAESVLSRSRTDCRLSSLPALRLGSLTWLT